MKKVYLILLTIIIFSNNSCKDNSTTTTDKIGVLRGTIVTTDGNSTVPNAKIFVQQANIISFTDSNGIFTINNLHEGTYDIYITKDGYDTSALFGLYFPGYFVNIDFQNIDNSTSVTYYGGSMFIQQFCYGKIDSMYVSDNYIITDILDKGTNSYITDTCWEYKINYDSSNYLILFDENKNINKYDNNVLTDKEKYAYWDFSIGYIFTMGIDGKDYLSNKYLKRNFKFFIYIIYLKIYI